jgi:hypothetical protein
VPSKIHGTHAALQSIGLSRPAGNYADAGVLTVKRRERDTQGVRAHAATPHLHAAELAARAMRDPEDRKKFVTRVRNALADSIVQIPGVIANDGLPAIPLRRKAS